jgi:signal transduction histidine kinase
VGISPEDMPHVFEAFFSHRANGKRGMGLGLSICYSIVEKYDGDISAINKTTPEGEIQGACIKVILPLAGENQFG